MTTARAATIFSAEDLRVVDRDLGDLAPGLVRIRFGAGGICGSDMHYFRHGKTGDYVVREPLVLGHEISGIVEAVGSEVTGLQPGTRVAVNPFRPCGHCPRCREGRANLCENVFFMGSASKNPHMQGGFSSYFDTTSGQCVPVPDHVAIEAAALGRTAGGLPPCGEACGRPLRQVGRNRRRGTHRPLHAPVGASEGRRPAHRRRHGGRPPSPSRPSSAPTR